MMDRLPDKPKSEIILYQTEDGQSRIEVRLENETVWLSQRLMSGLYQVGVNTINHHIKTIYEDGELSPETTIRKYRIVQTEGSRHVERLVEEAELENREFEKLAQTIEAKALKQAPKKTGKRKPCRKKTKK